MQESTSANFTDVDRSADPHDHVLYLDQLTGMDFAQAYRRQSFRVDACAARPRCARCRLWRW